MVAAERYCELMSHVTDRVNWEGKATGSVRRTDGLSARLFSLYLLNRLTFQLESVCVMIIAWINSKGHRSRSKVNVQRVLAW